jgi:hypothetical protein
MFREHTWTHKSYRPLITLSYWLQYHLNGYIIIPQPLRLFNCFLHSTNALLLLGLLLGSMRLPILWSVIGAGLFAAHPVHTGEFML